MTLIVLCLGGPSKIGLWSALKAKMMKKKGSDDEDWESDLGKEDD